MTKIILLVALMALGGTAWASGSGGGGDAHFPVCFDTNGQEVFCPPAAHRHVEKSIVTDIGNGEIQIELIKGINSEVVIMSREKAEDLVSHLDAVLYPTITFIRGDLIPCVIHDDAKPAAR